MVWLDLGGNIGTFTVNVLAKGCKVYTYEPEPNNYKLLKKNIDLNSKLYFKNRVKTYKKAVSTIDKMVNKGHLKKNTAARRKSRLTRHINSLSS